VQGPPAEEFKTHLPSVAHYTIADWRNSTFERETREQFLENYSLISSDRSLSRGYLEGLRQLLVYSGPSSELSQAVTIVSFASYGHKHRRPEISTEAKFLYFQLLQSFQRTISNVATSNIVEPLLTAVLLGLYEVRRTRDERNSKLNQAFRSSPRLRHIRVRTVLIPGASRPFWPLNIPRSISSRVQSCSRCPIHSASTQRDWRLVSSTTRVITDNDLFRSHATMVSSALLWWQIQSRLWIQSWSGRGPSRQRCNNLLHLPRIQLPRDYVN
jgi:hypothetical protein